MEILAVTILTAAVFLGLATRNSSSLGLAPAVEYGASIVFVLGSVLIITSLLMRLI